MSQNYPLGTVPPPPAGGRRRRWPVLVGAGVVGAVVAAVAAAVITVQVRDTTTAAAPETHPPVTATVPAPAPPLPAPLPTAQADRQTCEQGWIPAGNLIDSAEAAMHIVPKGSKIDDPAVRSNPEWSAALQKAGDLYRQASDALKSRIAPGTTPILAEAANTAVQALRLLGDTISKNDPISGNAGDIGNATAKEIGVLCTRLVH